MKETAEGTMGAIDWLDDGRLKLVAGSESGVISSVADMVASVYDELGDDGSAGFAAARAVRSLHIGETELVDTDVDDPKERRLSELLESEGASEEMARAAARAVAKYVHEDYPTWKDRAGVR